MPTSKELADHLVQRFANRGPILGSELGTAIKQFQPSVNFRRDYSGLRGFVMVELQGTAHWQGRSEYDDIYLINGDGTSASTSSNDGQAFWQAFSNPNSPRRLFLKKPENSLVIREENLDDPDFVLVPKLSSADYRERAQKFVDELPVDLKLTMTEILKLERYWGEWSKALINYQDGHYWRLWGQRRREFIVTKFNSKLIELGVDQQRATELTRQLDATKGIGKISPHVASQPKSHSDTLTGPTNWNPALASPSANKEIYEFAKRLVEHMSIDELRQMKVSLGAVLDAVAIPPNSSRHST